MADELTLGMLTTYELRDRKRALDQALRDCGLDGPKRVTLEQRLAAVVAEQQERSRFEWPGA
jgi:hypothetical protein